MCHALIIARQNPYVNYLMLGVVTLQPSWPIWCNARVSAMGFYRKAGWTVESEEFEIEGVGPHVRMLWARS
jgi:predicted GNAT family N-acyltransferase